MSEEVGCVYDTVLCTHSCEGRHYGIGTIEMGKATDDGCMEIPLGKPFKEKVVRKDYTNEFRINQLESKLKEASEFIQKLGPTIDYDIVAEIEEMLDGCNK